MVNGSSLNGALPTCLGSGTSLTFAAPSFSSPFAVAVVKPVPRYVRLHPSGSQPVRHRLNAHL